MNDSSPASSSDYRELDQVQRWMQAVITHPDGVRQGADSTEACRLIGAGAGQLERVVTRSENLTAEQRLAIYANAYYARLLECLGEVYPILKRTLGEEVFNGFAFGYLQQYPSRSYTLNELGRYFARYLQETRPVLSKDRAGDEAPEREPQVDWPDFLIDLARLEWLIYEVFDGPGVEQQPLLQTDDLLAIPKERWPEVHLQPVVCLRLLAARFPVNDYYTAMRKSAEDKRVPFPAAKDSYIAVTRRDFVVYRYPLSHGAYALLNALKEGTPLTQAIQQAVMHAPDIADELPTQLQNWFQFWTAEGFFQSVHLNPAASTSSPSE
jgi:hypothetical protein